MLIDSRQLMYLAFQHCRHYQAETPTVLALLLQILPRIEQSGNFIVDVPSTALQALPPIYQEHFQQISEQVGTAIELQSEQDRGLLHLAHLGAQDMQRLRVEESEAAVRSLGYGFHTFPRFLLHEEEFDPERYGFSFRIIASHWGHLSEELRAALCQFVGREQNEVELLIKQDGWVIDMWRILPRKRLE